MLILLNNPNQNQKVDQISKKNQGEYKKTSQNLQLPQMILIKFAQILKWEVFQQRIKRDKPIYKLWYQQTGKSPQYFLLDTYQKHREMVLDHLPVGSVNNFILNQGQVYQFFYGFG